MLVEWLKLALISKISNIEHVPYENETFVHPSAKWVQDVAGK